MTDNAPLLSLINLAVAAPSADNTQPWMFALEGSACTCRYYRLPEGRDLFGPMGHATLLSAGALQENLDRALRASGARESKRVWIEGNWSLQFQVPARCQSVDPSLEDMRARHTNRHPYKPLPEGALDGLPESQSGFARATILDDRSAINLMANAVRKCSEVRFNTQELHEWLFGSLRWSADEVARGDGLDLKTMHLPPLGSSFMRFVSPWPMMRRLNRLGSYKLMAAADAQPVAAAPALIGIVGQDHPDAVWGAGRLLQSIWIELNRRGCAVHPYYVITDLTNRLVQGKLTSEWQEKVRSASEMSARVLRISGGEKLHILLRVGTPTRAPVRSLRRAPESFLARSHLPS